MIGETCDYVCTVAAEIGGTWEEIADQLPLAIGIQIRNFALAKEGVRIMPPGRTASAKAREILGDHAGEWS